jgi:hypothetical protein
VPTKFKVRASSGFTGRWHLIPDPIPNQNLLLGFNYLETPADITDTAVVPLYPSDATMIQAVMVDALIYMNNEKADSERDMLGVMVVNDRVRYGEVTGTNDQLGLDPSTFRY